MLKDILIKCGEILCRDDIVNDLKSIEDIDDITNIQTKNDVYRLLSYYNYTITKIYENFIDMNISENFTSDKNRKIYYQDFSHRPNKILSVEKDENLCYFSQYFDHLLVKSPNTLYTVTYNFIPKPATSINDPVKFSHGLNEKVVCYGIVSEFFASKSMFVESDYWNNRFMYELFKLKTYKERRVKSTFTI